MDNALTVLLSLQFVLMSLMISFIIFIIRKVVEYLIPKAATDSEWKNLVLPIMPIVFGGLIGALISSYPYPVGFTALSGRIFFGIVAGGLSTIVFRGIQTAVKMSAPTFASTQVQTIVPSADPNVLPSIVTTTIPNQTSTPVAPQTTITAPPTAAISDNVTAIPYSQQAQTQVTTVPPIDPNSTPPATIITPVIPITSDGYH